MSQFIDFNINEYVRVKLNDKGRRILRDRHAAYAEAFPGSFPEYREPKEDADGWSQRQAWDLMQTFGQHVTLGLEPPFSTTIQFAVKPA